MISTFRSYATPCKTEKSRTKKLIQTGKKTFHKYNCSIGFKEDTNAVTLLDLLMPNVVTFKINALRKLVPVSYSSSVYTLIFSFTLYSLCINK